VKKEKSANEGYKCKLAGRRPERMEVPLFLGKNSAGESTCFGPDGNASFAYCRHDGLGQECLYQ